MDDDALFLKFLDESQGAVWLVAKWLHRRGYNVTVNAAGRRPTRKDWADYADNGDLNISMRMEVKGLTAMFTGAHDWPFGENFIVCAKHAWDRATPKPYGFIYLNKERNYAALVMGDTHKSWRVSKRRDSRFENLEQQFYFCPLDKVVFFPFNPNKELTQ